MHKNTWAFDFITVVLILCTVISEVQFSRVRVSTEGVKKLWNPGRWGLKDPAEPSWEKDPAEPEFLLIID